MHYQEVVFPEYVYAHGLWIGMRGWGTELYVSVVQAKAFS